MNGKYILRISLAISLSHPPIASRSSFPHTLRMVLVQKISKRSTPMPMRPFERIPPSSQPKSQKTGKPNARNMLHLASLSNKGKPKSRRRLRRSKPVVAPRMRTTMKMRMMNSWGKFLSSERITCLLMSGTFMASLYIHPNPRKVFLASIEYSRIRIEYHTGVTYYSGWSLMPHKRQFYHLPYP